MTQEGPPLYRLAGLLFFCLGLVLSASPVIADPVQGALKPDLRILIDISGSMKESDPDNLRQPALELIVRLLPDGARAGVWLFGEDVETLVEHRVVDAEWRKQARQAVSQIDSSGLRTNIPAALAAATYDWGRMDPGYRTSILLLTDGKVDVSESPMVNATAARKLLTERALELGQTGIPVHTIALSDEADWKFLDSLAQVTGGAADKAGSAEDLSRIFLRSVEMAAPMARVPITNRSFMIDDSVKEFTALVFHDNLQPDQLQLVAPDGVQLDAGLDSDTVDWFISTQFAMVTVSAPVIGSWSLTAPPEASLRVTVISDLQLDIDPPPNSLPTGRRSELGLRLLDKGQVITDPEILQLFAVTLEIRDPEGERKVINVSARYDLPENGEYRVALPALDLPGRYQLMARIRGETLRRKLPMYIDVYATGGTSSISTRPVEFGGDQLMLPALTMAGIVLFAILVGLVIRRRRQRRRIALWKKRALDTRTTGEQTALSGVRANDDDG